MFHIRGATRRIALLQAFKRVQATSPPVHEDVSNTILTEAKGGRGGECVDM